MNPHIRARRDCDRARALGSQALDGPLSEIESRELVSHRQVCPACDEVVARMADLTRSLRAAPALEPRLPVVAASRPRRSGRLVRGAAVAAAVAAAAAMGAYAASPGGSNTEKPRRPLVVADRTDLRAVLSDARVTRLWVDREPRTQGSPHRSGALA